jgi:hypothetical protein
MAKKAHQLTDEQLLKELETFLEITEEHCSLLKKMQPLMKEKAAEMEEVFYRKIRSEPNMAEYLDGSDVHSRHVIIGWTMDLLGGRYDLEYLRKRWEIGVTHFRIGLPVRYPIVMMEVIRTHLNDALRELCSPEEYKAARVGLNRLLSLDMAIFNHAYEETIVRKLDDVAGISRDLFFSLVKSAG